MDFTFHGGRSSSSGGKNKETRGCDGGSGGETKTPTTTEEYDPSQPLDSSEDEEDSSQQGTLNFEKSIDSMQHHPPVAILPNKLELEPQRQPLPRLTQPAPRNSNVTATTNSEPEIDLNSIPMPSDEYRRPTIQFSIPARHKLLSMSTLIKRQKGVMKKQDKGGGGLNFNSEVSKAFQKGDGQDSSTDPNDTNDDDKPKHSLLHEIFGSDDEDGQREEDGDDTAEVADGDVDKFGRPPCEDVADAAGEGLSIPVVTQPSFETNLEENKWKTVAETVESQSIFNKSSSAVPSMPAELHGDDIRNATTPPWNQDEIQISIKPSSELLEAAGNESSSPDIITLEEPLEPEEDAVQEPVDLEDSRGKENKQIVLECVSDTDDDFEVTFVGVGRANLMDLRQGRLTRRNVQPTKRSSASPPPCNGFEEGEIVESDKRRKRDKKKKKSKKRKRSKDSRVSSKMNSERSRSGGDSERKSLSDSDYGKEVPWRKPKLTKARNYRNGKRESEEKLPGDRDRTLKRDEPSRKRSRSRSLNRYSNSSSFSAVKTKSRRRRSISNPRHRSRSKSGSISPISRRMNRSRGFKRTRRSSYRSRSIGSNHSSPSRSRSLTRRKAKKRQSPSPIKRHRNRSISVSPVRAAESRPHKRNRSVDGQDVDKHDKPATRVSPVSSHNRKVSKVDAPTEDNKKKTRKDKVITEDVDKEKKKKKKRREKSISPVKAIVADGDSIVVSLSFQKAKEEPSKSSKSSSSSTAHNNNRSSEIETTRGSNNNNNNNNSNNNKDNCEEIEAPIANYKTTPRKGTILIKLDASPNRDKDSKKSPVDGSKSDDTADRDVSKKSQEDKTGSQDQKLESDADPDRVDELDFVSSSHENSVDNNNAHSVFSSSTPTKPDSPLEKATLSASRSPYKFGEFFVSSTCSDSKSLSPVLNESPKTSKTNELPESSLSQKSSRNSPFQSLRSNNTVNDNGSEKPVNNKSPSPEIFTPTSLKPPLSVTMKPMIGNIPGLFPSGFSSSGLISTPSVIIPAPPKIVPNTAPSSLINNLVSVASALYAPLLAAKQPNNSGLSRHNQSSNINLSSLKQGRTNNGTGGGQWDADSPFSPNSSDGDDLFEPPQGDGVHGKEQSISNNKKTLGGEQLHRSNSGGNSSNSKYGNDGGIIDKRSLFDTIFTPGSQKSMMSSKSHGKQKRSSRDNKRSKHKRGSKRSDADKNGEMEMNSRLNEDVPNSAVSLKINEKYLKKLNRQERVVEEVKLSLKPHYVKKHITKEEYKDILRKAVPKICHNKSGEINPNKIKELIEAYVKKFRKFRKAGSNG